MHNAQKTPKIRLLNLEFLSRAAAHVKLSAACGRRTTVACVGFARGVTARFSASNNSTTRKCVILCAAAIDVQTKGRP
jgi:hypothetical protein